MKSKVSTWFEAKVAYDKIDEHGTMKTVTELYVIEAMSFADAEQRITEELSSYVSGEFEVRGLTKAQYGEVFFSEAETDDRWYKCKLQFIIIDEKSGKEKRTAVMYLVQAATLNGAVKNIDAAMSQGMADYDQANVAETKIVDVYEFRAEEAGN